MIATIVHVWVKEANIQAFKEASKENHLNSIKEEGNLRFDILQDSEDPTKFTLYEAFASEEFAAAHKNTSHYKKWREKVADWMAQPRQGVKHAILFPEK